MLLPAGQFNGRRKPEDIPPVINEQSVPSGSTIADYFWFVRYP